MIIDNQHFNCREDLVKEANAIRKPDKEPIRLYQIASKLNDGEYFKFKSREQKCTFVYWKTKGSIHASLNL